MKVDISCSVSIERSPRVRQVESMFDVPPSEQAKQSWVIDCPIEDREWNIGLIVGPSGAGKTTIARQMFGAAMVSDFAWSSDRALVDDIGEKVSIKDITQTLSAVGLGSVPAWLRPYPTLSTGEQFRATVARALI